MKHCRLIGSASTGLDVVGYRGAGERGLSWELRGSAVNYHGNPRFHPHIAFKIANTS
jgi:hypothetical protein